MTEEPERIVIKVDWKSWTMAEHEDFEEYVGVPYEQAFIPVYPTGTDGERLKDRRGRLLDAVGMKVVSLKVETAVMFIDRRRQEPTVTLEQVRALPRANVVFDFGGGHNDPKDKPAKRPARKRTASSQRSAASTE